MRTKKNETWNNLHNIHFLRCLPKESGIEIAGVEVTLDSPHSAHQMRQNILLGNRGNIFIQIFQEYD